MKLLLTSFLTFALVLLMGGAAHAQLTASDNLGIFPPGGPFNPNGRFAAIGESGGVPGPTLGGAGCDLYGFRSQFRPGLSVNLGIKRIDFGTFIEFPTLTFEGFTFWISGPSSSSQGGSDYGCGPVLAFYNPINPTTYTIYGSANAIGGMWVGSDRKLKRDIKPISNAIETVQQLAGVTYNYNTEYRPDLRLSDDRQYGFVAQDVEKVLPELVRPAIDPFGEEDDYVVMNYDGIIPVLTEAIKEQQEIMDDQQVTIEDQERRLDQQQVVIDQQQGFMEEQQTVVDQQQGIIAKQQLAIDQLMNRLQEVEATLGIQSDVPANQNPQGAFGEIKLNQNRPNPADGNTIIEYTLPTEIAQAQLVIFDVTGAEVKRYKVETGFGSVEIQEGVLAAGTYLYTLEVEGQSVARRKMVIQ
ncbi:MAG: tail fiber domain-containing protein [Bacteroidota bacterium]